MFANGGATPNLSSNGSCNFFNLVTLETTKTQLFFLSFVMRASFNCAYPDVVEFEETP
jgi:hypothetical protein